MTAEDYTYNIRGWLTNQTAKVGEQALPLFSMVLNYYNAIALPNANGGMALLPTPSYTGNITQWLWINSSGTNAYHFAYDPLGRLTDAEDAFQRANKPYEERDISYDRNGNILTLTRTDGSGVAANLAYSYIGDQLSSLDHNNANGGVPQAGEFGYSYDVNGNMTVDARKNLQIQYNYLNLLQKAVVAAHTNPLGAYVPAQTATYKWLADGTKVSVVDAQGNGFAYLGSLTYKLMNGVPVLESTSHGSGRIVVKNGAGGIKIYDRQYHITDHLGSVRVVFNQDGEVIARNDFYPFGKPHANPSLAAPADNADNRYLFNGKEKQLTGGLNLLDYGARMYDNETGRWFGIDPLAEKYISQSPYHFSGNNPMKFVDTDGRDYKLRRVSII